MPTDPTHKRSIAAALGGSVVIVLNAVFGWAPSPEVAAAEATIIGYLASLLPGGG